jgi:hypothetical protein
LVHPSFARAIDPNGIPASCPRSSNIKWIANQENKQSDVNLLVFIFIKNSPADEPTAFRFSDPLHLSNEMLVEHYRWFERFDRFGYNGIFNGQELGKLT